MTKINILGKNGIEVNGLKLDPTDKGAELLALLILVRGRKITANDYWRIVKKPKRLPYNAKLCLAVLNQLKRILSELGIEDILTISHSPVRSCKINLDTVECDYYDMLDGKIEKIKKDDFLPTYPWAADYFLNPFFEIK